jgi:hypothetical protein
VLNRADNPQKSALFSPACRIHVGLRGETILTGTVTIFGSDGDETILTVTVFGFGSGL